MLRHANCGRQASRQTQTWTQLREQAEVSRAAGQARSVLALSKLGAPCGSWRRPWRAGAGPRRRTRRRLLGVVPYTLGTGRGIGVVSSPSMLQDALCALPLSQEKQDASTRGLVATATPSRDDAPRLQSHHGGRNREPDMDPHQEDAARRLRAPLVLHECPRILGSHYLCMSTPRRPPPHNNG